MIKPIYSSGDCTIHHHGIHFADATPISAKRAIVFRITLYSLLDKVRPNHAKWYSEMIAPIEPTGANTMPGFELIDDNEKSAVLWLLIRRGTFCSWLDSLKKVSCTRV